MFTCQWQNESEICVVKQYAAVQTKHLCGSQTLYSLCYGKNICFLINSISAFMNTYIIYRMYVVDH